MSNLCICGKPCKIGAQNKPNKTCGDKDCKYASRKGIIRVSRIIKKCIECGKNYTLPNYRKNVQRYCSHHCANIGQTIYKTTTYCEYCSKEFRLINTKRHYPTKYCSPQCVKDSGIKRINSMKANLALQKQKTPTKPEAFLYNWLNDNNIEYIAQYPIQYWIVDAYIPKMKIIIQVDGDYWHGNPIFYPNPNPEARIRKRMGIDKSQNIWFAKMGYTTIRIWESEIYENISSRLREITATFTDKI